MHTKVNNLHCVATISIWKVERLIAVELIKQQQKRFTSQIDKPMPRLPPHF